MLRAHPHLQGLVLGTALLAAAVAATPFALAAVTGMTDNPAGPVDVAVVDGVEPDLPVDPADGLIAIVAAP